MMKGLPCHVKACSSSLHLPTCQSSIFGQLFISIIAIAHCQSPIQSSPLSYPIVSGRRQYVWKKILISLHAIFQLGLAIRPSFWQIKCQWQFWSGPLGKLCLPDEETQTDIRLYLPFLFVFTFPLTWNMDIIPALLSPSWDIMLKANC